MDLRRILTIGSAGSWQTDRQTDIHADRHLATVYATAWSALCMVIRDKNLQYPFHEVYFS